MGSKLSGAQLEAVQYDGHLLIVAGPGSGKTTTSVSKATRILRDPDRSLVMVTFTKEAAEETRKRLTQSLGRAGLRVPGEERLIVATFHSLAIKHLSRGGPRVKVLPPSTQDVLFRDATFSAGVTRKEWGEVQHDFERYMYSVDQDGVELQNELSEEVISRYRDLLSATGQTDLYSVMRDCAIGVSEKRIAALPYTDMLVDEGQDTDDLQRLWIFAHARAGCRVTIVGDDDQSIYEWRNALGYEGMRSFLETFKAHRIELGDNFRCKAEILGPAATMIAENRRRLVKHLLARRGRGGALVSFACSGAKEQNEMLADLILECPDQHRNAVVLARVNRSLDQLEMILRAKGVAYKRMGQSIWQQPVIAGYLAFLQMLVDGGPTGLLPVLQAKNISDQLRRDLLFALRGNATAFLDGVVPAVEGDRNDLEFLGKLASNCAYWRRQLSDKRLGSVREVILDTGQHYATWTKSDHGKRLVEFCSSILADLRDTLSERLRLVQRKERDSAAPVTLMTMHGAKGLEFQTVHLIDTNNEDDGSGINPEQERRLLYVALTRARDCCVAWTSARPHTAIVESQMPPRHTYQALVESVRASAPEVVAAGETA